MEMLHHNAALFVPFLALLRPPTLAEPPGALDALEGRDDNGASLANESAGTGGMGPLGEVAEEGLGVGVDKGDAATAPPLALVEEARHNL